MIAIRKAWWATVLLAAFAGCNNEEPKGENPPPPPPPTVKTTPPETPPAVTKDEAKPKEEAKSKDEGEMPKEEAAKDEGLKLTPPTIAPATKDQSKDATPKDEPKNEASAASALTSDEIAEIEKLPAADRVLALNQVVCPVSGEHLGAMGAPVKVSAEGKSFLICCKGCNKDVMANPKDVIAKLNPK